MPKQDTPLPTIGTVKQRFLEDEMREAYLDYAMSVIVSRALPDVRDGLKPVHRRILYSMNGLGLRASAKHRKSATVVGECFVKDTLVSTPQGLRPIQELKVGDKVYTQTGVRRVVNTFKKPKRELLRVSLERGFENVVTKEQPFKVLTNTGSYEWKFARDLAKDDYIVLRSVYPDIEEEVSLEDWSGQKKKLNTHIAYLLGALLSDGWISHDYGKKRQPRLGFCFNNKEVITKIQSILETEFFYSASLEIRQASNKYQPLYTIRVNNLELSLYFIRNFFKNNGRLRAHTKFIPQPIFQSPRQVISSFMAGYLDGDGSVHAQRSHTSFSTVSEKLGQQLQTLLAAIGIVVSRYRAKSGKSVINGRLVEGRHKTYAVELNGYSANKFLQELLPFIGHSGKKNRARRILSLRPSRTQWLSADVVPFASELVFEELSSRHRGGGWYTNSATGGSFRMGLRYLSGSKIRYAANLKEKPLRLSQMRDWGVVQKLSKIGSPLYGLISEIETLNLFFLKVKSVTTADPQETYDIEVEQAHELIANGMVSHNCLGKYHPHGDAAVYDSMVHLAQDFSMRYPLVDGQGNFGCFTKDTKVKLTDGRDLTFGELVEEYKNGKKNYTYTVNKPGLISIAEIKHPRVTRKDAELVRVTLDNGEKIRCTPDHRFMLKDGSYQEAQYLSAGESLMPLYQKISEKTDRLNREGYILIYQPKTGDWVPAHHLADNYNLTNKVYAKRAGRVRHHIDFNKTNNDPENIVRVHWGEHWEIHYKHAKQQHQDPDYRQKLAEGRDKYWSNKEVRAEYSRRMSQRNKENWQDESYREEKRQFLSWVNKKYFQEHPEARIKVSAQATKTLKRLWQDPEYRAFMHEKIIKGNKNHTTNKTGWRKFINICKEVLNKGLELTEANYEKTRTELYPSLAATSWQLGIQKYYQNNPDLVLQEINKNHKVLRVEWLSGREDVYDLTVDHSHNFALASGIFVHNSLDGDPAAAYRYTEAKLTPIAEEILSDIEKETVNFRDNFDGRYQEPVVMPSRIPQLLMNGTLGIAVGMATDIPPHNLGELIDALSAIIDNPELTSEDLMEFVKGPDFPTGGIIYDWPAIKQAYATGKGSIVTRAKTDIVENKNGALQIIISEIPYRVNKANLLEKFADLVRDKKVEGIRDLRDESDKDGVRIVVDLKKEAIPKKVLNQLFKYTQLQDTFHMNALSLVNGLEPQIMNLKDMLEHFLAHRVEVVTRRSRFELKQAEARAHILEGLKKALDNIDKIIATIKKAADKEEAREKLIKNFKLSEIQAGAILEMRLQSLAGLERKKIEDELEEKRKLIDFLKDLLKSPKKIAGVVKEELMAIREKYADERRTQLIKGAVGEFSEEDLIAEADVIVQITESGYVKRVPETTYRTQGRGGKGVIGQSLKEEDVVQYVRQTNTHDDILFFTNTGKVFQAKVYELPEGSRTSKGSALVNFLQLSQNEHVTAVYTLHKEDKRPKYLVMATRGGVIKKTAMEDFDNVRRSGLIAINLKKDDTLEFVRGSFGDSHLMLTSSDGQAVRFKESDVRAMGRTAAGVKGMRLRKDAHITSMDVIDVENPGELLVIGENGYGKRTKVKEFKVQGRGGSGIKAMQVTKKTGPVISMFVVPEDTQEDLVLLSKHGQAIRVPLKGISTLGRATQGVRIMKLDSGDTIASVTVI